MWLSILIFNTAESTAELINSAVMLYLAKPLRDNPCGDVGIERWVHCLYVWQMRMVNFPVISTASSHANIFTLWVRPNYALHYY